MIDEKKLLCAFIHSAYEGGYCGLMLGKERRESHKQIYADFIAGRTGYPETEIRETQQEMMGLVDARGVREYVYCGHLGIVIGRIERETGLKFDEAVRNAMVLNAAMRCPVSFYQIVNVKEGSVVGKHLVLGLEQRLNLLDGNEMPKVGDIVSGHWNEVLEIVDSDGLKKYQPEIVKYFSRLKPAMDAVKNSLKKK
jgi:hypothetical protein